MEENIDPIHNETENRIDLSLIEKKVNEIREEISKFVVGQEEMIDLLLIGLLSGGHVLLEGMPGIAKTLTAKVLAKTLSTGFSRIQFTPDLMPSDIIGTSIFDLSKNEFNFKEGPIFSNIVLIDEINRSPAKTQAALFEVMEEKQITVDGKTYNFEKPFMVMATQNPIEQEGTYNLPEAQLDRFLFKVVINYPKGDEELQILTRFKKKHQVNLNDVNAVLSKTELVEIQSLLEQVEVEDNLLKYITQISTATRNHGKIYLGGSPRASLNMMIASKTFAAFNGRDYVIPDDIQFVAGPILNHRVKLTPEAEMEGLRPTDILEEILQSIEVPR